MLQDPQIEVLWSYYPTNNNNSNTTYQIKQRRKSGRRSKKKKEKTKKKKKKNNNNNKLNRHRRITHNAPYHGRMTDNRHLRLLAHNGHGHGNMALATCYMLHVPTATRTPSLFVVYPSRLRLFLFCHFRFFFSLSISMGLGLRCAKLSCYCSCLYCSTNMHAPHTPEPWVPQQQWLYIVHVAPTTDTTHTRPAPSSTWIAKYPCCRSHFLLFLSSLLLTGKQQARMCPLKPCFCITHPSACRKSSVEAEQNKEDKMNQLSSSSKQPRHEWPKSNPIV